MMLGKNNPMSNRMIVEKMLVALKKTLKDKRPNKREQYLIDIFNKNNIPLKYVGQGDVIIGGKIPDFINEEKRILLEYNEDFWHKDDNKWYNVTDTSKEREELFRKLGYETIFLWTKDYELGEKHIVELVKKMLL